MKKLFAVAFIALSVALLLLFGYTQKQEAKLKTRVEELEVQQKLTARSLDELLALTKSYQNQNRKMFDNLQRVSLTQITNMDKIGRLFLEHLSSSTLHSRPEPIAARAGTTVESQPLEAAPAGDGVPLAVYNTIAVEAIKKWPRDYQKQENYIQAEIQRYRILHR